MASKIKVKLDVLENKNISTQCKQNDDLVLEASIYEGSKELDLTNSYIIIQARKSDLNPIVQDVNIAKLGNTIIAELDREFTKVPGLTIIEIVMIEKGKQNTTFSFSLLVEKSVINIVAESKILITPLERLQNTIIEAKENNEIVKTTINSAKENNEALTNTVNAAVVANTKAEENINNLNLENTTADTNISTLTLKNTKAEENITNLDTKNTEATANIAELETKIAAAGEVKAETEQLIATGGAATKGDIAKVNSSLEQKLNKDGIVTMANMGQDVKEAMTGGSVAVVGKNTILTENIVDNQITAEKVSFISGGKFIADNHDYFENKTPILSNAEGTISALNNNIPYIENGEYYLFGIDVIPNKKYKLTSWKENDTINSIAMWKQCFAINGETVDDTSNSRLTFTSVDTVKTSVETDFIVPSGANYMFWTIKKTSYDAIINTGRVVTLQEINDNNLHPTYPIVETEQYVLDEKIKIKAIDNIDERVKVLETEQGLIEDKIIAWGNSLTFGAGAGGTDLYSYPAVLSKLIGKPVFNMGVGGETIETILGRQGSLPMFVEPFTIPSTITDIEVNLSSITSNLVTPLLQATNWDKGINPCTIDGIEGTLSYNTTDSKYYFTRTNIGESKEITRPTPLVTKAMREKSKNQILLIWLGENDKDIFNSNNIEPYSTKVIDSIKTCVSYVGTDKYIVLSPSIDNTVSTYSEVYKRMAFAFGEHYLDIANYLVDYGLEDCNISATETDIANIEIRRIPLSLRSDGLHLNANGYKVVAEQVYKKGKQLGYW